MLASILRARSLITPASCHIGFLGTAFVAGCVEVSGSKQGDQRHENRVVVRFGAVYETVQILPLGKECLEVPVRFGAVGISVACLVHGHQLPSRRHASLVRICPLPYHFGTPYIWGSDGGAE